MERIVAALDDGASKASVCRSFKVPRSTLIDTLHRAGWTGAGVPLTKIRRAAQAPSKPQTAAAAARERK